MRQALSWRDRILFVNGVLFCLLGLALLIRFAETPDRILLAILGVLVLAYGGHRVFVVGKAWLNRDRSGE